MSSAKYDRKEKRDREVSLFFVHIEIPYIDYCNPVSIPKHTFALCGTRFQIHLAFSQSISAVFHRDWPPCGVRFGRLEWFRPLASLSVSKHDCKGTNFSLNNKNFFVCKKKWVHLCVQKHTHLMRKLNFPIVLLQFICLIFYVIFISSFFSVFSNTFPYFGIGFIIIVRNTV